MVWEWDVDIATTLNQVPEGFSEREREREGFVCSFCASILDLRAFKFDDLSLLLYGIEAYSILAIWAFYPSYVYLMSKGLRVAGNEEAGL